MNIDRCSKCKRALIEEESKIHECKEEVLGYKIKGNTLWMFNGKDWFPMKLKSSHQPRGNTYNTTEEGTEPALRFCYFFG